MSWYWHQRLPLSPAPVIQSPNFEMSFKLSMICFQNVTAELFVLVRSLLTTHLDSNLLRRLNLIVPQDFMKEAKYAEVRTYGTYCVSPLFEKDERWS